MKLEYLLTKQDNYTSIYQILKSVFDMSNRLISKLKRANQIYCNNESVNIHYSPKPNDVICIDLSFEEECDVVPTDMPLDILYEDDGLLIINKWTNTPVHPSLNHYTDSLSNGVKSYFDKLNIKRKIRPINRLDKDTTGIVLFAKNEYIQECLIKQMKENIFKKDYLAIVNGIVPNKNYQIIAPIARKDTSIIERCVSSTGDYARTDIEVIQTYANYSYIKCSLKTGRTHQIRVHTSHIGHPILGDTLYGSASNLITRQALHAYKIDFIHPITKENITITAPLPEDMQKLI